METVRHRVVPALAAAVLLAGLWGWGEGQAAASPEADAFERSSPGADGTDIYYGTPGQARSDPAPRLTAGDYPRYGTVDSRLLIWIITQQHTG